MDNFYTILLYVGALLLIGLVKSISRAGKKKPATQHFFSTAEEKNEEVPADFNSVFDFLQSNPILPKIETKPPKRTKPIPVLSVQNEEDKAGKKAFEPHITLAEKEGTFIFEGFDLPTAIVYSEILKRPDY
jgi:hypothetical protein